jgi:hypothetical protein
LTVDSAERRFDSSSWGEVSEKKLQTGFIKKIDGKKIKFSCVLPPLDCRETSLLEVGGGQNLERDWLIKNI